MWSDQASTPICPNSQQQVPMTGLQAKRKRDEEEESSLPALKCGRGVAWPSAARPTPRLVPVRESLWTLEDNSPPDSDEEEEDDDELDELEGRSKQYLYPEQAASPASPVAFYRSSGDPYSPPPHRFIGGRCWSQQYCYQPQTHSPTPTQTIRCAENGKSYLELGSAASTVVKSRMAVYRQQRQNVFSLSMLKLARFRQYPDPSLHRSVLICNTLRRIERETEQEKVEAPPAAAAPQQPPYQQPIAYPATPPPQEVPFFEPSLRDLASPAPRVTPFPSPAHPGAEESVSSSINWSSVLSLSSQSDLDPLNNNGAASAGALGDDLDNEWRLGSDDSVLKSLERTTLVHQAGVNGEELVDSLMQVLVGT
ncbi:Hypothetical predicted protein [Cloeon dipterum]|uniref:SERTA domain-containing protein n=2 Tax=Cloeon dipterum TaxID=197152 RepID=A0A8S1D3D3_9INSE|nr:Hypothetical predicted protein [Cloeon dipterum]